MRAFATKDIEPVYAYRRTEVLQCCTVSVTLGILLDRQGNELIYVT